MPRQPKSVHPVRALRAVLGKTQAEVAAALGIATVTLKKIENGQRLKLTREHANRLAATYGVDPESVLKPSGTPRDLFDRAYSNESLKDWKSAGAKVRTIDLLKHVYISGLKVGALLDAAIEKGAFMEAKFSFDDWLASAILRFDLDKSFNASLRKLTVAPIKERKDIEWLKAKPGLAERLDVNVSNYSGAVPVEVEGESYLMFKPRRRTARFSDSGKRGVLVFTITRQYKCRVRVAGGKWKDGSWFARDNDYLFAD